MTITLGALTLDDNLQLRGLEARPLVTHTVSRTILGRTIVETMQAPAGHALELTADDDGSAVRGVFLRSDVDSILALRDSGAVVLLVHPRATLNVMVTGVDVDPVFDVNDPAADWWFTGSVQLLTV